MMYLYSKPFCTFEKFPPNNNMGSSIFYLFQCTTFLQIDHHIWQDTSTSIESNTNTLFRKNI